MRPSRCLILGSPSPRQGRREKGILELKESQMQRI